MSTDDEYNPDEESEEEHTSSSSSSSSSDDDDDENDPNFEISGNKNKETSRKEKINLSMERAQDKLIMVIKRQTGLPASPASQSFTSLEDCNLESYLLANTRLKYKSIPKKDLVPNDARKGKGMGNKPRKGTRGLGGRKLDNNLPERVHTNFSVTKETIRAADNCVLVHNTKHKEEIRQILEKIIPDFPRWLSFMWEGFNIILHGFGSKLLVVNAFRENVRENFGVCSINGLCPKLNARKIMSDFVETLKIDITIKGATADVISEEVCKRLPDVHPPVFLIVQNFDTLAIGSPNILTVICSLAQIPWVHLLATTDSVNASLGVTQNQCVQLNFCWISCSTFQPYIEEFTWTPNIFGEAKGSKGTESTLQYVLKSLTGNARKAFSILASLQLSKLESASIGRKKRQEFAGVEFAELARKCKDNFVAHTDSVLRTLLVEFVDHKLITNHSGKRKGMNLLSVDLDIDILRKVVNDGI